MIFLIIKRSNIFLRWKHESVHVHVFDSIKSANTFWRLGDEYFSGLVVNGSARSYYLNQHGRMTKETSGKYFPRRNLCNCRLQNDHFELAPVCQHLFRTVSIKDSICSPLNWYGELSHILFSISSWLIWSSPSFVLQICSFSIRVQRWGSLSRFSLFRYILNF